MAGVLKGLSRRKPKVTSYASLFGTAEEASRIAVRKTSKTAPLTTQFTAQSVLDHAFDTFGSATKMAHWMARPNQLLQGKTPRAMLNTDPESVEAALVRIDFGVYA